MTILSPRPISIDLEPGASSPAVPRINPLFDQAFYATTYGFSLEGVDLYNHYIYVGRFQGFDPNRYFDSAWYLAQNKDVREIGADPLDHYLERGADEGRNPSLRFDGSLYLVLNPDVRASGMNPLLHFLLYGRNEGRHAPPIFLVPASTMTHDDAAVAALDEALLSAALPVIRQLSVWTGKLLEREAALGRCVPTEEDGLVEDGVQAFEAACPDAAGAGLGKDVYPSHLDHLGAVDADPDLDPCSGETAPALVPSDGRVRHPRPARVRREPRVVSDRSPRLVRLFSAVFARDLASHFHKVRLLGSLPRADGPLVFFTNHPSWWDAELYHWLAATHFPQRRGFATMEAVNLERYKILTRLGAFPVRPRTFAGASCFLRTAEGVLQQDDTVLFIAIEGRFRDVRERPVRALPGLAHLARRVPTATFVPLAIDYVFWSERRPNLLLRFGAPIGAGELASLSAAEAAQRLSVALETAMSALAEAGQSREPRRFQTLLEGRVGFHWLYDLWRHFCARFSGTRYDPAHRRD